MLKDRTASTLLLAALLVALGGRLKPVSPDPLERDKTRETRFYVMKTFAPVQCDLIVLGDSRALRAVSPAAMAGTLPGLRIFNFAYNAGGLNPEMYEAATERLDPRSPSRIVAIGITPLSIMTAKADNEQYRELLATARDQRWLLIHAPGLASYLQPVKPVEFARLLFAIPPRSLYHQDFHDDGWIGSHKEPEDEDAALREYAEQLAGKTTDPELVRNLLDQTRAWAAQGVRVFGFRPPATDAVAAIEDRLLDFDVRQLASVFEAAGGTWLSFPNTPYRTYDGSHLRRESAIAFSAALGAAIHDRLEAPPGASDPPCP